MQWIDVNYRLPELPHQKVLVAGEDMTEPAIGSYHQHSRAWIMDEDGTQYDEGDVQFWMPLPEMPC